MLLEPIAPSGAAAPPPFIASACCSCCASADGGNLRCVTDKWPAGLPHLFAFTGGESGRFIRDGGSDPSDLAAHASPV